MRTPGPEAGGRRRRRPAPPTVTRARSTSEDDCWVALYGEVYDFTDFLEDHPAGAEAITRFAGTDGTEIFDAVHSPGMLEEFVALGAWSIETLFFYEKRREFSPKLLKLFAASRSRRLGSSRHLLPSAVRASWTPPRVHRSRDGAGRGAARRRTPPRARRTARRRRPGAPVKLPPGGDHDALSERRGTSASGWPALVDERERHASLHRPRCRGREDAPPHGREARRRGRLGASRRPTRRRRRGRRST